MITPAVPHNLKFVWSTLTKNGGVNVPTNPGPGGGVVFGAIICNLIGTASFFGIFDAVGPLTTPTIADLVFVLPIPASGSLIILPEDLGICECRKNLNWYVYGGTDPQTLGAPPAAGSVSVQLAFA